MLIFVCDYGVSPINSSSMIQCFMYWSSENSINSVTGKRYPATLRRKEALSSGVGKGLKERLLV